VSIYSLRLPKVFFLNVSRKFPISALLTIFVVYLLILDKRGSLGLLPTRALPIDICTHKSKISVDGSWEISHFLVRLRRLIHSSLTTLSKSVLKVSSSKLSIFSKENFRG